MSQTFILVGAGIIGLSAARALAKKGHRVRLVDQGPIPNPLAASHDQHRLIRYPYGAMTGYAAMTAEAYPAWDRLWTDLGRSHYVETGTLVLSRTHDGWADASAGVLDALRIPYERLTSEAVAERFSLINDAGVSRSFYQPQGGVLKASAILADLARYLESAGVELMPHTRIARIDREPTRVYTEDGRILTGDAVVLAAGAWSRRLIDVPVTASRQVVVYAAPPPEARAAWAASPMLLEIDPDSGFYLVPPVDGLGLKIGDHRFSLAGDPDAPRAAEAREIEAVCAAARERIRAFDRFDIERGHVCFYAVAPEERFIVRREGGVWVLAGFSGHGFKFGPLVGEQLAEAVEANLADAALARWAAGWMG
ncbi:MAG: FAD-dependent oxidoreductase [Rhodothermales bacterium]